MNNIERIVKDASEVIRGKVSEVQTLDELAVLHLNAINQVKQNCKQMCEYGYTQKEADEAEEKLCLLTDKIIANKRSLLTNELKANFNFEFAF